MLVTSEEILYNAKKDKYAVPAFNANCLEMCLPIIRACEKEGSPLILQLGRKYLCYMTHDEVAPTAVALAKTAKVPVAIHLDHAITLESCEAALKAGFTSIMFDGSNLDYEQNIEMTKKVVALSQSYNVPVEGEVGKVGMIETTDLNNIEGKSTPEEVLDFVNKTNIQSVAVAVGNVHNMRTKVAKIDFDLIRSIASVVSVPLVMHGSSGISDEDVRKAITCGISKVNVATDFNVAFVEGLRKDVLEKTNTVIPMEFFENGMKNVYNTAIERIKAVGADGRY